MRLFPKWEDSFTEEPSYNRDTIVWYAKFQKDRPNYSATSQKTNYMTIESGHQTPHTVHSQ